MDGQQLVNVSLVYDSGDGPRSSSTIMSAGEIPPEHFGVGPTVRPHIYGDENSPVIAFTYPKTMGMPFGTRLWLMAGWVNDPRVHEFTIQLSEIGTITLYAEKHQFFVGIAARRPMTTVAPNVVIDSIVAVDSQGNVIP